jgi:hypothetical protein
MTEIAEYFLSISEFTGLKAGASTLLILSVLFYSGMPSHPSPLAQDGAPGFYPFANC